MSAEQKPRGTASGRAETELSRFKDLWQRLSEEAQGYWREQFNSRRTQADLRKEIQAKFKINLASDVKLTRFRAWLERQDALDAEAEAMQDDEQRLVAEFGKEWTLDQIREEVLKRSYARALSTGDFDSGRKTIVQDLNVKKVMLDERKVALLEKKAAQADAAKNVLEDKELTEDQRAARMREIFGLK